MTTKASTPAADRSGVTVDREGYVTAVALPSNGLRGEIPASFGGLSRLQSVDLRGNVRLVAGAAALAARQACENAEIHFAKAQLGVGVSGGSVSNALGPAIYLEGADGTEVVACLDVRNAFCEMSREAACKALMNSSDENIKALAPVFHAANSASLRAKGVEVQIEEGGGQGVLLQQGPGEAEQ